MTGRYQPYIDYKESNYNSLGAIPSHWNVKRLKQLLKKPFLYGANEAALEDNREHPRFIRITDMAMDGTLKDETFKSLIPELATPYMLEDNDILLARSGATVGKSFIYKEEFGSACFAGYLIKASIKEKQFSPRFVYWFCQSDSYWQSIGGSQIQSTIQNVSAEKYGELRIAIPQIVLEQQEIADFLDYETAKIDQLIAKQKKLIELLKEKRQTVISHAVTKGLNPDAETKDSGVEWLGQVPKHWKVGRYKFCTTRIIVGIAEAATHAYADKGTPIIRSTNIKESGLEADNLLYLKPEFAESNTSKYLKEDDVVTVRTGYPGISAVVPEKLHNSHCFTNLVATPNSKNIPEFLSECLNSHLGKAYFELKGWGSAQQNISVPILQNTPIACPSKEEQLKIVDYVKDQRLKYGKLIENAKLSIQLMKERKTALISAAVTGKIDVRNWQG